MVKFVRKFLKCDTIEDCCKIQKGHLFLKRLGKLSVLFSIAVTLIINDIISWCINVATTQYNDLKAQYEVVTGSVLFKWTLGWFCNPPPIPLFDQRVITLYSVVNVIQFCVFIFTVVWCLRWVYADCRVESGGVAAFRRLIFIALISNAIIYVGIRFIGFKYLT